jgi:hypothetical protein
MSVAFCPSRLSLARASSARPSVVAHAKVGTWLPGAESPEVLDGSLPGDYGFDPLGLVRSLMPPRSLLRDGHISYFSYIIFLKLLSLRFRDVL